MEKYTVLTLREIARPNGMKSYYQMKEKELLKVLNVNEKSDDSVKKTVKELKTNVKNANVKCYSKMKELERRFYYYVDLNVSDNERVSVGDHVDEIIKNVVHSDSQEVDEALHNFLNAITDRLDLINFHTEIFNNM